MSKNRSSVRKKRTSQMKKGNRRSMKRKRPGNLKKSTVKFSNRRRKSIVSPTLRKKKKKRKKSNRTRYLQESKKRSLRQSLKKKKRKNTRKKSSFRSKSSYDKFLEKLILPEKKYDEEPRIVEPLLVPPSDTREGRKDLGSRENNQVNHSVRGSKSDTISKDSRSEIRENEENEEKVDNNIMSITIGTLPKWSYSQKVENEKREELHSQEKGVQQSEILESPLGESLAYDNNLKATLFGDTEAEFQLINKSGRTASQPDRYSSDNYILEKSLDKDEEEEEEEEEELKKRKSKAIVEEKRRKFEEEKNLVIQNLPRRKSLSKSIEKKQVIVMIDVGVQVNTIWPRGACYQPVFDDELPLNSPEKKRENKNKKKKNINSKSTNNFHLKFSSNEKIKIKKEEEEMEDGDVLFNTIEDGYNIGGWMSGNNNNNSSEYPKINIQPEKISRISMVMKSTENIKEKLKEIEADRKREMIIRKSMNRLSTLKNRGGRKSNYKEKKNVSVSEIFGSQEGMSKLGIKLDLWKERIGIGLPNETYETKDFIVIPKEVYNEDEEEDYGEEEEEEESEGEEEEITDEDNNIMSFQDFRIKVKSPEKKLEIWRKKLEKYEETGNWKSLDGIEIVE